MFPFLILLFALGAWYCFVSIRSGKAAVVWGSGTPYICRSRRPWLFWTMVILAGVLPFISLILFNTVWM